MASSGEREREREREKEKERERERERKREREREKEKEREIIRHKRESLGACHSNDLGNLINNKQVSTLNLTSPREQARRYRLKAFYDHSYYYRLFI